MVVLACSPAVGAPRPQGHPMKLLVPVLLLCSLVTGQSPVASEKPVTPKVEPAPAQQDAKQKQEPAPTAEKKGQSKEADSKQDAKGAQDPAKAKPAADKTATTDGK